MPVSFIPILFPLALIALPLICLYRSAKAACVASGVSLVLLLTVVLSVYIPGWLLMIPARQGDPAAMYELARWTENHAEQLNQWILVPSTPDVLGGFVWLERAAALDYPPAVYAVGVRLKHGDFVPRPLHWTGPGGNVFPQPERGQPLIDKALAMGYHPTVAEEDFYWDYRTVGH